MAVSPWELLNGGTSPDGTSTSVESQSSDSVYVREPIAVVGFGLKFPGDSNTSEDFWRFIQDGRNACTDIPQDHFNPDGFYHSNSDRLDSFSTRGLHHIKDMDRFDAGFFSITAAEANAMDPQQRGVLEVAYKALENAGMPISKVAGSRTSVFNGCFTADYQMSYCRDFAEKSKYAAPGIATTMLANRVSWFFNLKGPSCNIDSACSSSLMSFDLACQSIWSGDTDMGLATGCNLAYSPELFSALFNFGMLASDSLSRSFDQRGAGYARGEGFAAVMVKRLSAALRDGDTIRAVVRSAGSGADGYTPGLTQPSQWSQAQLVRDCYTKAQLDMGPTRYFEAHGTGTPVGDPIEASGIGAVFKHVRTAEDPLYIGSVKSNIGHLEGASGLAGVIKCILILERGIIPPVANLEKLNAKIDATHLKLKFPTEATPWPSQGLRRVGVSSFGFGGSNSHAILDDAFNYLSQNGLSGNHVTAKKPPLAVGLSVLDSQPVCTRSMDESYHSKSSHRPRLLLLSAADPAGTLRNTEQLSLYAKNVNLDETSEQKFLGQLAHTLSSRRSLLSWRSSAVVSSVNDLLSLKDHVTKAVQANEKVELGFVFTGQGAQWFAMGRELFSYPTFASRLREADEYVQSLGCTWSLVSELHQSKEESSIDGPEYSQIACTALQIALVDLLESFGVQPRAVTGHSSGEIAAAYTVGALSAQSAWRIAYFRGKLAAALERSQDESHSMIAVGLSDEATQPYLQELNQTESHLPLVVACINSPASVTVSGPVAKIERLESILVGKSIFARKLRVNVGYHSPQMRGISEEYAESIGKIERNKRAGHHVVFFSSLKGCHIQVNELSKPDYWIGNMVEPVRFVDALSDLCKNSGRELSKKIDLSHRTKINVRHLVEIGPHSALQGPIRDILKDLSGRKTIGYSSLLVRNRDAVHTLLSSLGTLHCLGYPVHVDKANQIDPTCGEAKSLVGLPPYQFDHTKSFWTESRLGKNFRTRNKGRIDLLGTLADDQNPLEARWRNFLNVSDLPWLEDHKINGFMLYPGAGAVVMAIEAAKQMVPADREHEVAGFLLKDVKFLKPLSTNTSSGGTETYIHLSNSTTSSDKSSPIFGFRVFFCQDDIFTETCNGSIQVDYREGPCPISPMTERERSAQDLLTKYQSRSELCNISVDSDELYHNLAAQGFGYGESFCAQENVRCGTREAVADIRVYQWRDYHQPHVVHPTTLDACFQLGLTANSQGGRLDTPTTIPSRIGKVWISSSGLSCADAQSVGAYGASTKKGRRGVDTEVSLFSKTTGELLLHTSSLELTSVASSDTILEDLMEGAQVCYHTEMQPDAALNDRQLLQSYLTKPIDGEEFTEIHRWMGLMIHKRRSLRILQLGVNEEVSTIFTHAMVGKTQDLRTDQFQFDILLHQIDESEQTPMSILPYGEADWLERASGHSGIAPVYDVVVIPSNISHEWQQSLNHLMKQGFFDEDITPIVVNTSYLRKWQSDSTDSMSQWQQSLRLQGFETVCEARTITALNKPKSPSESVINILLVHASRSIQEDIAHAIKRQFSHEKLINVTDATLSEASEMVLSSDTIIMMLVDLENQFLSQPSTADIKSLQMLLHSADLNALNILWATSCRKQPYSGTLTGFTRSIRSEYEKIRLSTVNLDEVDVGNVLSYANYLLDVMHPLTSSNKNIEPEYILRKGLLNIPRLVEQPRLQEHISRQAKGQYELTQPFSAVKSLKMELASPGLLDSIRWVECDDNGASDLMPGQVEIKVGAVGVTFLDLQMALSQVDQNFSGLECSGVITKVSSDVTDLKVGDRVAAAPTDTFQTLVRTDARNAIRIPESMTLQEAASFPVCFITAYHCLVELARLESTESVLIHAGAGATGQAAVQIAQHLGAEVFITVGSAEKKQFMMDHYGILESHILYSRDTSFAEGIRRLTAGRGVDVVLNSLTGEELTASWECIAPFGKFIEIGRKGAQVNRSLLTPLSAENITFASFDLVQYIQHKPAVVKRTFQALLRLFTHGKLVPLSPVTCYDISEIEAALRTLQSGKHIGKIVLNIAGDSQVKTLMKARSQTLLDPTAAYLITGGLGGIARSIARWMVQKGARHLVLTSRSGPRTDAAHQFLSELRSKSVTVDVPACDAADMAAMENVLSEYGRSKPRIAGCVHGAMITDWATFENMSSDLWRSSLGPKAQGAWILHQLLPRNIDFFLMLSSITSTYGPIGQSNYAAANSYLDALAHHRRAAGQKAVALGLGIMADEGFLSEHRHMFTRTHAMGQFVPVTNSHLCALLDYYCNPSLELTEANCQPIIGIDTPANIAVRGSELAPFMHQPLFNSVHRIAPSIQASASSSSSTQSLVDLATEVQMAATLAEAVTAVTQRFATKLAQSIGAASEDIEPTKPVISYGIDSLTAVDLRNWFAREVKADVAIFDILGGQAVQALASLALRKSKLNLEKFHAD